MMMSNTQFKSRVENIKTSLKCSFNFSLLKMLYISSFVINFLISFIVTNFINHDNTEGFFKNKKNILNIIFVKKGWAWTTLVIIIFYVLVYFKNKKNSEKNISQSNKNIFKKALISYIMATLWWIFFTQWFFGYPLIHRFFLFSGGKCYIKKKMFSEESNEIDFLRFSVSHNDCKYLNGIWKHGHDISGHVFLITHSSLFLFLESSYFWNSWSSVMNDFLIMTNLTNFVKNKKNLKDLNLNIIGFLLKNPHILIIPLLILWHLMLFCTNIYFHSVSEKLSALFLGYLGMFIIRLLNKTIYLE